MAINLTKFKVEELHGRRSIEIPIHNNKLILVGENGSGKTTIINLIYYFLSRQWGRLSAFNFKSLGIIINDEEIIITKEQLPSRKGFKGFSSRYGLSRGLYERLRMETNRINYSKYSHQEMERLTHNLSLEYGIPLSIIMGIMSETLGDIDSIDSGLVNINERIGELVKEQILYLPTYRRIEQDLKTIFPNIDHETLHKRLAVRQDGTNYIELVEFGMEDVDKNIELKMNELKEFIRSRLNKLTGSYLKEVISGQYKSFRTEDIERISAEAIDSIIKRIGEDILPDREKKRMRTILGEIQSKQKVTSDHKVVAHFLLKLLEVYEAQQQKEENIRRFVDVCNQYLNSTSKKIVFDNNNFNISIVLDSGDIESDGESSTIQMKQLSSGEKQIVSLFSHLFLSGIEKFFVLIDEPDLSLSVDWQTRLLPDILSIEQCTGLIAVTHSPFIFQNELDTFTHSLNEFWN